MNTSTSNSMAETVSTNDTSFVEVMDVDDRRAAAALSLSVTPRHDTIGVDAAQKTNQVCVTIKARDLPDDDEQRAPVDIVVALDVSGSMSGDKLEQCKKTLELLLRVLLPRDRFALISFSSEATIEIPAQHMTMENKEGALRKIKSLGTRGCTNISAAIGLAAQEMTLIDNPNEVRSIFLLTDGHANEGITGAAGVVEATKNCLIEGVFSFGTDHDSNMSGSFRTRQFGNIFKKLTATLSSSSIPKDVTAKSKTSKSPPISLHCFGYGNDHDSSFLRQVSNATPGGTYYFVENDSNVGAAFGDALGGILSVVSQNAVVNIKVPPEACSLGVKVVDVHHNQKVQRDDGSYSVTIGDFYAEESRDVIFEVSLATSFEESGGSLIPHAQITLAFTDTIQKRPEVIGPVVCSVNRPKGNEVSEAHQHVIVQWLRVYTTRTMAEAEEIADRNQDLAAARAKIQRALETIRSTAGAHQSDPLIEQLISELQKVLQGLSSRYEFDSGGGHYMRSTIQSHALQRCSQDTYASATVYRGRKKAAMSLAFSRK